MTDIRNYLKSLPASFINDSNEKQILESKKEYKEFLRAFEKGCCYICGMKLSYFNESEKCLHWFLLPDGIRKKHFKEYLKEPIGFFQLDSYLRWVANLDGGFKNINDLSNDNPDGKIEETTIRYNDIEWSLNYGKNDLSGHIGSQNSDFPHFHLQIIKAGKPFIRFNDCHIPFSDFDQFMIEAIKNEDLIEHHRLFGDGISVLEDEDKLKIINDEMVPCDSDESATFHSSTFFMLPENKTITLGEYLELKDKAKEKGVTLRKYMEIERPDISLYTEISPGSGVVEKKGRNKRK